MSVCGSSGGSLLCLSAGSVAEYAAALFTEMSGRISPEKFEVDRSLAENAAAEIVAIDSVDSKP